jgi:protein SCO1/2
MSATPRNGAIVLFLIAVLVLVGCGASEDTTSGPTTTSTDPTKGFVASEFSALIRDPLPQVDTIDTLAYAANGKTEPYPLRATDGGLLLVYFGFTSCPDICPTTLADVRDARAKLPRELDDKIDVVMFSVDPETDTPETLISYVTSFNEDARAMVAVDNATLTRIGEPFLASWTLTKNEKGVFDVQHSPFLYGVDDKGRLVATWPFSPDAVQSAQMAFDFEALLTNTVPEINSLK